MRHANGGYQQALSVLDGGQVTVTLSDGNQRTSVVRSTSDSSPRSTSTPPDVTVLAQGEIEAVGAQSAGRMHLVDRLVPERGDFGREAERLEAEIKSVTVEIRDLLMEVDGMEAEVFEARDVPDQLAEALELEASALESVRATEADRAQLASLQNSSAQTKVQQGVFQRSLSEVSTLDTELEKISKRAILAENWPDSAGEEDMISPLRVKVTVALGHLDAARNVLSDIVEAIESNVSNCTAKTIHTDQASREIRQRLDQVEEGVGAISRRVEELRESSGQLSALRERLAEKQVHVERQIEHRNELYRALDNLRQKRFASRERVADSLTRGTRTQHSSEGNSI